MVTEAQLRKYRIIKACIQAGIYNARVIPHEILKITYEEHLCQQILGELHHGGFEIVRRRKKGR